jgi:hypothetical protein
MFARLFIQLYEKFQNSENVLIPVNFNFFFKKKVDSKHHQSFKGTTKQRMVE